MSDENGEGQGDAGGSPAERARGGGGGEAEGEEAEEGSVPSFKAANWPRPLPLKVTVHLFSSLCLCLYNVFLPCVCILLRPCRRACVQVLDIVPHMALDPKMHFTV